MANSLEKEYKKTLAKREYIKNELALLPEGYISKKVIYGTNQYYLQKRVGKRVVGKHIAACELQKIRDGLASRADFEKELIAINDKLLGIEAASKLVSRDIYKRILLLKACMPMETLSAEKRERASSFAEAMNAIEGVSATVEMKSNINAWCSGEVSFLDVYEATLKKYGFPVEVK